MSLSTSETLRHIISFVETHYDLTDDCQRPCDNSIHEEPADTERALLSLSPITADLDSKLRDAGIPIQLRQLTLQRASNVVATYEQLYRKARRHLLPGSIRNKSERMAILDVFQRKLEHSYKQRDVVDLYNKALTWYTSRKRIPLLGSQLAELPTKRFNYAFAPFLEAYLEQNAFPTIADQRVMAEKSGMSNAQIMNWFQNHRSRARKSGREADLKRLTPGQSVDIDLIEEKIKSVDATWKHEEADSDLEGDDLTETTLPPMSLNLDELASSMAESIPTTYTPISVVPCVTDKAAFGLPSPTSGRRSLNEGQEASDADLNDMFNGISIPAISLKACPSKQKPPASNIPPAKTVSRTNCFKATLRSCFSAAITLTHAGSHPALIPQKNKRPSTPSATNRSTILEQQRLPVLPYTLPAVLPTWELYATPVSEPIKRKKPTISTHGCRLRPGAPYPQQTISRVSSASSLASIASDHSQSSLHSMSSSFSTESASTSESSIMDTPAQSPTSTKACLIDDLRFGDDIFNDYLYWNSMDFNVNVEEPFNKNVSLSIDEFDTTTLPTFDFFES